MVSSETTVEVVATQITSGVSLAVSPGTLLHGSVTTLGGRPVDGARVRVQSSFDSRDRAIATRTDTAGRYELPGLPAGKHDFLVEADGHASLFERVDVVPGARQERNVTLKDGVRVHGRVDVEAQDRRDVIVTLSWLLPGSKAPLLFQKSPAREGAFEFNNLSPGAGSVDAVLVGKGSSRAAISDLAAGQSREVILKIEGAGAWISGSVVYTGGGPASGVTVIGHQSRPDGAHRRYSTSTDTSGRYRLGPFFGGQTFVLATADGGLGSGLGAPSAEPDRATVTLEEGKETKTNDLKVSRADQEIAGHVVDEKGSPVAGALVFAGIESHGPASRRAPGLRRTITGNNGEFSLAHLPAGKYSVWASSRSFADAQQPGVATGSRAVQLQLHQSAAVAGWARHADGSAVVDFTLRIFPIPTATSGAFAGTYDFPLKRVHDPEGAFDLTGFRGGEYQLLIQTPDGASGNARFTLAEGERKQDVSVTLGKNAQVN
jgi:hypothetical protein